MPAFHLSSKRTRIHLYYFLVLACTSLASLFAWMGSLPGLFSHFQFYLALGWAGWLLFLVKERNKTLPRWRQPAGLLCSILAMVWHGHLWAEPFEAPAAQESFESAGTVRLLWANVQRRILHLEQLLPTIEEFAPDVIAMGEVRASSALDSLAAQYPHQIQDLASGLVLLSRYPIENPQVIPVLEARPILTADILAPAGTFKWIVTHVLVPPGLDHERTFGEVVALAAAENTCLAVGDWNTTPWSAQYSTLIRKANLNDARQGHGAWPTWRSKELPLVQLPIDHVFWKGKLRVKSFKIGQFFGSDHFPLLVVFDVKKTANNL